uniref:Heterogeneous nuclear ribonucleoprotein L RRM domain-containing protein n=1 Tax=Scophthalmus maximus TaxID=52904 RepID=A0A8D3BT37_SCOMX
MVEMGDCYAVDRAIPHLNNNFLFGQKLNVCVSKQQAIVPGQCYELEDGSSSFKDFHGSRNNRFTSPEQAAKNRIQHPSNVLHFNAQPTTQTLRSLEMRRINVFGKVWLISTLSIIYFFESVALQTVPKLMLCSLQICDEIGVKVPINVKMFTGKSGAAPSDRSVSGSASGGVHQPPWEALALINHYQMKTSMCQTLFTALLCKKSDSSLVHDCHLIFSLFFLTSRSVPLHPQTVLLHCSHAN